MKKSFGAGLLETRGVSKKKDLGEGFPKIERPTVFCIINGGEVRGIDEGEAKG